MAEGFGSAGANTALDQLGSVYSWIKLHTGAPGSAGTSNAATETTRKQATWSAAAAGVLANSNTLTWTAIAGSQDATHFSCWTASSAGTFGFSGTITANAYTAGDNYSVAIAALTASLTLAS